MGSNSALYKILISGNVNTFKVFFWACQKGPRSFDWDSRYRDHANVREITMLLNIEIKTILMSVLMLFLIYQQGSEKWIFMFKLSLNNNEVLQINLNFSSLLQNKKKTLLKQKNFKTKSRPIGIKIIQAGSPMFLCMPK